MTANPLKGAKLFVDPDPASASYLYLYTTSAGATFPYSYIDSGTNGLFFHDTLIAQGCQGSGGASSGGWYCPATTLQRSATISDAIGGAATLSFDIANADTLFSTAGSAYADLGGDITAAPQTFVWGMPFFFGRSVYSSIWGQVLSENGPWNAF